jgi:hypothetical protein
MSLWSEYLALRGMTDETIKAYGLECSWHATKGRASRP